MYTHEGNRGFFPRVSVFTETKSRHTLPCEEKQNSSFPGRAYIKSLLLSYKKYTRKSPKYFTQLIYLTNENSFALLTFNNKKPDR